MGGTLSPRMVNLRKGEDRIRRDNNFRTLHISNGPILPLLPRDMKAKV